MIETFNICFKPWGRVCQHLNVPFIILTCPICTYARSPKREIFNTFPYKSNVFKVVA